MIDFHQHLGIELEPYLEMLDRNDITKAVLMPYDFGEVEPIKAYHATRVPLKSDEYINGFLKKLDVINEQLYDLVKNEKKIIFTPWLSPECDKLDYVISKAQIVKFVPIFDNYTLDWEDRVEPLIEKAKNKIVMIHTGWDSSVEIVKYFAGKHKDQTFVIAHMKEDTDGDNYERQAILKKYSNVYCETSFPISTKRIWQYVQKGFGKKLLFGSDYRLPEDEQSIRGFKATINEADISQEQKNDIFTNNALRLLQ